MEKVITNLEFYKSMTTFSPITLECSVCDEIFESSEIGSCGYGTRRTDFRPNYWGFNPVNYFYHLCPNCGFCAPKEIYKGKFENSVDKLNLRRELDRLKPIEEVTLSKKVERAMICLEIANKIDIADLNDLNLANNWLEAFWWAETEEEAKRFGEKTLRYYKLAFEKDEIPEAEKITTKYLIGEINRRLGKTEIATKFFDEVISLTENIKDLKDIYNLTLQQKSNPQENIKVKD